MPLSCPKSKIYNFYQKYRKRINHTWTHWICSLFFSLFSAQESLGIEFRALEYIVTITARTHRMGYSKRYRTIPIAFGSVARRCCKSSKTIGKSYAALSNKLLCTSFIHWHLYLVEIFYSEHSVIFIKLEIISFNRKQTISSNMNIWKISGRYSICLDKDTSHVWFKTYNNDNKTYNTIIPFSIDIFTIACFIYCPRYEWGGRGGGE